MQGGTHADARLRRAFREEGGQSEESADESEGDDTGSQHDRSEHSEDEEVRLDAEQKQARLAAMLSLGPEDLARLDDGTRAAIEELRALPDAPTNTPPVRSRAAQQALHK